MTCMNVWMQTFSTWQSLVYTGMRLVIQHGQAQQISVASRTDDLLHQYLLMYQTPQMHQIQADFPDRKVPSRTGQNACFVETFSKKHCVSSTPVPSNAEIVYSSAISLEAVINSAFQQNVNKAAKPPETCPPEKIIQTKQGFYTMLLNSYGLTPLNVKAYLSSHLLLRISHSHKWNLWFLKAFTGCCGGLFLKQIKMILMTSLVDSVRIQVINASTGHYTLHNPCTHVHA